MHKGIAHERLVDSAIGCCIVVVSIAATKDIDYAATKKLHISSSLRYVGISVARGVVAVNHRLCLFTNLIDESGLGENRSSQVIAPIDTVAYPGERCAGCFAYLRTYVGLRMAKNVGVAGTTKSIIDTPVAEIDPSVAGNGTFEAAAINEFCLCQIVADIELVDTCFIAMHVDGSAILTVVVGVFELMGFAIAGAPSDSSQLATAKNFKEITCRQVDGGVSPDFGVCTIASSEDAKCCILHILPLNVEDDT